MGGKDTITRIEAKVWVYPNTTGFEGKGKHRKVFGRVCRKSLFLSLRAGKKQLSDVGSDMGHLGDRKRNSGHILDQFGSRRKAHLNICRPGGTVGKKVTKTMVHLSRKAGENIRRLKYRTRGVGRVKGRVMKSKGGGIGAGVKGGQGRSLQRLELARTERPRVVPHEMRTQRRRKKKNPFYQKAICAGWCGDGRPTGESRNDLLGWTSLGLFI